MKQIKLNLQNPVTHLYDWARDELTGPGGVILFTHGRLSNGARYIWALGCELSWRSL